MRFPSVQDARRRRQGADKHLLPPLQEDTRDKIGKHIVLKYSGDSPTVRKGLPGYFVLQSIDYQIWS